jgi:hypothetical protein
MARTTINSCNAAFFNSVARVGLSVALVLGGCLDAASQGITLGMPAVVTSLVWFLIALLVGFEAASLRRWTYKRRRWDNLGPVVAPDRESAERRFFDSWTAGSWTSDSPSAPQAAPAAADFSFL